MTVDPGAAGANRTDRGPRAPVAGLRAALARGHRAAARGVAGPRAAGHPAIAHPAAHHPAADPPAADPLPAGPWVEEAIGRTAARDSGQKEMLLSRGPSHASKGLAGGAASGAQRPVPAVVAHPAPV